MMMLNFFVQPYIVQFRKSGGKDKTVYILYVVLFKFMKIIKDSKPRDKNWSK